MGIKGVIFNIQRYCVHDGPGIRTVVFLKGCPLRCLWCSNPEGQNPYPEILYYEDRCKRCFLCRGVCPRNAIEIGDNKLTISRERWDACGKCVESCSNNALRIVGRVMSVEDVLEIIKSDMKFYYDSEGGVTLSGGEPLYQADYSMEILKGCKKMRIHTAIETSGYAPWDTVIKPMLPYIDLILFDIKHIDPEAHRRYTGVSNELILRNLKLINSYGGKIVVAVPLIPSINMFKSVVEGIARFLSTLRNVEKVVLRPYHRLGVPKYRLLGREYKLAHVSPPAEDDLLYYKKIIEEWGITCEIG